MQKIVKISLFIVGIMFTMILVLGSLSNSKTPIQTNTSSNNSSQNTALTLSIVSKHNSVSDCWLIIENKVYDVTSYIHAHPGNTSTIIKYCGTDGTKGFITKDSQQPNNHSQGAYNLLVDYYLGDVSI